MLLEWKCGQKRRELKDWKEVRQNNGRKRTTHLNKHPFCRFGGVSQDIIQAKNLPKDLERSEQQKEQLIARLESSRCWFYRNNIDERVLKNLRENIGFCSVCQ
jgi:hypothetical protein